MESPTKNAPRSSLMSPPEAAPYESFSRFSPTPTIVQGNQNVSRIQFPSPPVSPEQRITGPEETTPPNVHVPDPLLYDYQSQDSNSASTQPPLFSDTRSATDQRVVDEHISARSIHPIHKSSAPRRDDYLLVLEFKSKVAESADRDRGRWFRRERGYLLEDQRIRSIKELKKLAPAPLTSRVVNGQISKVKTNPKPRSTTTIYRNPRPKNQNFGSATPEPAKMRIPAATTTREDRDFGALVDYSPPISTLPNRPNSLKVEWKGQPINLSDDRYNHLLHPDEVTLAANLRLDCATYLTSKRRIFIARVECLKIGKEFRKTDSQQACKIDVNKASKLWTAFDKVGWLDKRHFTQFL